MPEDLIQVRAAWRDFNARGRGVEVYRLAADGTRLYWATSHPRALVYGASRLPPYDGTVFTRSAAIYVFLPAGTLIVEVEKHNGRTSFYAGRVARDRDGGSTIGDNDVRHLRVRRTPRGRVHVLEVDGRREEFLYAN